MKTTPLNNQNSKGGKKDNWTREKIAAALAAGAITTEAANILYDQLKEEPTPEPELTNDQETPTESELIPEQETTPEPVPEPTPEPEPEPEPAPEPEPTPEPEPAPEPEPTPEPTPEPEPTPGDEPNFDEDDDIVDIIVEEIDPQDIDMEDVLLIDDIGTIYMADGRELNAAVIHDEFGNEALMVDVDGDNVYDVITTPEGEIIEGIPGDIDVSDVELLYAQQHGDSGYLEQNDFDIAMNDDNLDIQDDISLT
ncbi:MAG: hypothetical protein J1E78_07735 [Muribaculaceae bacterium]|nr:hypothetical protein [Muribaculaceae bacterium]